MPRHASVKDRNAVPYILLEEVVWCKRPCLVVPRVDGEGDSYSKAADSQVRAVETKLRRAPTQRKRRNLVQLVDCSSAIIDWLKGRAIGYQLQDG